jgi:hypothetical protein
MKILRQLAIAAWSKPTPREGEEEAHHPIPPTDRDRPRATTPTLPKRKHPHIPLLHDRKQALPRLILCPLPSTVDVMLPRDHSFFSPRRPLEGELLVGEVVIECRGGGVGRVGRFVVVFADDGVGEVRGEAHGGEGVAVGVD